MKKNLLALMGLLLAACPAEHSTADAGNSAQLRQDAAVLDRDLPASCQYNGAASQAWGEACGCEQDCQSELNRCVRNYIQEPLGNDYCTTDCGSDSDCVEGFGCFTQLASVGVEAFCQRCISQVAGAVDLEGACICDADCGNTTVNGRSRDLSCVSGVCSIAACSDRGPRACPEGYTCESRGLGDTLCVACINEVPAIEGEACACGQDCEAGLSCESGVCRKPCVDASGCAEGQECRQQALGGALCADVDSNCGGGDVGIGQLCSCNADCAPEAPDCLTLEIGGYAVAMCTVRPCDTQLEAPCPEGNNGPYRCCTVPMMLPPTCVPPLLASAVEGYALCSP